jgi:glycosyltransferase involved in cell wall biosynthesis
MINLIFMIEVFQTYLPEIFIVTFGVVVLFQLLYYFFIFSKFSFHKQKFIEYKENLPVSIVITANNDAHHLIKTLPELLTQDYPCFEVVVVNDNSDDETRQVITDFQSRFNNLKLINLESSVTTIKGKKFPLSLGIKEASNEHILLTDSDCVPASNQWLKLMARHFNDSIKIVLGYSNIHNRAGLFSGLIRFDKLHQAIQYFSYCLAKIPFMGVGQNLAYTKTIFFNNNGFASQNHLQFGDDDLFINKVANSYNCAIEYQTEAHTTSNSGSNFSNWLLLRIFRNKTRKYYNSGKFLLNFYHLLMPLFYIMLGFAIYFTMNNLIYFIIVLTVFLFKFSVQYICFGFAAAKLNEKRLIPHLLLFDIIASALNPIIYIASKFKK